MLDEHVWNADQVWASASYATRINKGKYIKRSVDAWGGTPAVIASKATAMKALQDNLYNDADIANGKLAREWFGKSIMFKTFSNNLTSFDSSISNVLSIEDFTPSDTRQHLGLICSQVPNYIAGTALEGLASLKNRYEVGERPTITIVPHKCIYSENWGTYYIEAIADNEGRVLFPYKDRLELKKTYTVKGTIKSHDKDLSRLNRVTIIGQTSP
jgi:hypothetical protein